VKVLLSAFQCSPGRGSEPGTGWHWVTSLTALGHEVTVLTSSPDRDAIRAADLPGATFRFIDAPISPSLARISPMAATCRAYLRWQVAALREIQGTALDYDVVHHVTWGGLHLGSQLWRLPVPLIYGPIGGGQTAPGRYWRYFGRSWPTEALRTASTGRALKLIGTCRKTIRNSALTLVCNSATADACRRLGARKIQFMLADGLPAEWLGSPRSQPAGTPVVLFIGRLLPRKAPVLAIQAFAELRKTMPARLIVAGNGPLRRQVEATIKRLGITDDVELLGHVGLEDIKRLYDSASVLLFPSLRESFGAPFLEALGRGLPIVALDQHGIADAEVGLAAVKVPLPPQPRQLPGRLGVALSTVLSDDQWDARSAAAVKWASDWVWPVKAAAASELYHQIAGSQLVGK